MRDDDDEVGGDDSQDVNLWMNQSDGVYTHESYRPGKNSGIPCGFYDLLPTRLGWCAKAITMREDQIISDEDNALIQSVFKEVDIFWGAADFYRQASLAYKRGYLFHGRPGTGKSVLLRYMAQRFVTQNALVVRGNNPRLVSAFLEALSKTQPQNKAVVLFDDLDTIVRGWEDELLELMDGLLALPTGVLWVGATNYIDQIPNRLKRRPSRFDRLIEVSSLSEKVRRQYISTICPNLAQTKLNLLVECSHNLVFAELKELVLAHVLFGEPVQDIIGRLSETPLNEEGDDDDDDGEKEDTYDGTAPKTVVAKRVVVGAKS